MGRSMARRAQQDIEELLRMHDPGFNVDRVIVAICALAVALVLAWGAYNFLLSPGLSSPKVVIIPSPQRVKVVPEQAPQPANGLRVEELHNPEGSQRAARLDQKIVFAPRREESGSDPADRDKALKTINQETPPDMSGIGLAERILQNKEQAGAAASQTTDDQVERRTRELRAKIVRAPATGSQPKTADVVRPQPVEPQPQVIPEALRPKVGGQDRQANAVLLQPADLSRYVVQLASVVSRSGAREEISTLKPKLSRHLGNLDLKIWPVDLGQRGVRFRVVSSGFSSRGKAWSWCLRVKKAGQDCIVKEVK